MDYYNPIFLEDNKNVECTSIDQFKDNKEDNKNVEYTSIDQLFKDTEDFKIIPNESNLEYMSNSEFFDQSNNDFGNHLHVFGHGMDRYIIGHIMENNISQIKNERDNTTFDDMSLLYKVLSDDVKSQIFKELKHHKDLHNSIIKKVITNIPSKLNPKHIPDNYIMTKDELINCIDKGAINIYEKILIEGKELPELEILEKIDTKLLKILLDKFTIPTEIFDNLFHMFFETKNEDMIDFLLKLNHNINTENIKSIILYSSYKYLYLLDGCTYDSDIYKYLLESYQFNNDILLVSKKLEYILKTNIPDHNTIIKLHKGLDNFTISKQILFMLDENTKKNDNLLKIYDENSIIYMINDLNIKIDHLPWLSMVKRFRIYIHTGLDVSVTNNIKIYEDTLNDIKRLTNISNDVFTNILKGYM